MYGEVVGSAQGAFWGVWLEAELGVAKAAFGAVCNGARLAYAVYVPTFDAVKGVEGAFEAVELAFAQVEVNPEDDYHCQAETDKRSQ